MLVIDMSKESTLAGRFSILSGVAPKDRTKHARGGALGAKRGARGMRWLRGDTLKTSEALSASGKTEDRGSKWILGDQTELRDNLAVYQGKCI